MELQNQLAQILPRERGKSCSIDRIAYANNDSYFRLAPQAVTDGILVDTSRHWG
jgi:hypothetical protein